VCILPDLSLIQHVIARVYCMYITAVIQCGIAASWLPNILRKIRRRSVESGVWISALDVDL
jgi:hypothetical protein